MSHARLSPSGAGRWVKCPGSIAMCEQFPEQGRSESAEEGTAAHWVASEALEGKPVPTLGVQAPNGVIITQEMVECANVYVRAALEAAQGCSNYNVEQHIVCDPVHPECHGTPDLFYFQPATSELHVWDYKNGYTIVEPYENYQLIIYAIGALWKLAGINSVTFAGIMQGTTVVLHIVQPRPFHISGPIREWRVRASELQPYLEDLRQASVEALSGNGRCTSGPHCRYCNGRRGCPTLQMAAMISVDYTSSTAACQLSPAALAIELRTLQRCAELVKARITGMEQQAMGMIKNGTPVPGFILEVGKGRPVWTKPVGEVLALGEMLGLDLSVPREAVTPAVAKHMGLDADLLAVYSETPSNGFKLLPNDKSRIASVFGAQGV